MKHILSVVLCALLSPTAPAAAGVTDVSENFLPVESIRPENVRVLAAEHDLDAVVKLTNKQVQHAETLRKHLTDISEAYLAQEDLFNGIERFVARRRFNKSLPRNMEFLQQHAKNSETLLLSFRKNEEVAGSKRLVVYIEFQYNGHKVGLAQFRDGNDYMTAVKHKGAYAAKDGEQLLFADNKESLDDLKRWIKDTLGELKSGD